MMMSPQKKVRTRIAPSPTGNLHIGTARTALFCWLFAKSKGGEFIVRIEDTDIERSDPKFEKDILEGLDWLGFKSDEKIVKQSERIDIYKKYIKQLLEKNLAYYCFCTKDELEAQRQSMLSQGMPPKYSGECRGISKNDVKAKLDAGESHIIRFKVPETKVSFKDMIRGDVSFDAALFGDIAIAKDVDVPLYNFAVVIDDYTMDITHVIRGEDHVANTPKQILIQKALDFPQPHYAHLPLILDPDRSKMSKRYSSTSIREYRDIGYLPEAMINFMAFMGWHPKEEKDIMSVEELVKEFDISRVQKGGAIFNIDKLNWINAHYLRTLDNAELAKILGVENEKIISLVKDRMKTLSDFKELASFLTQVPDYEADLLIWKTTPREKIFENLQAILKIIEGGGGEPHITQLAKQEGNGEVLWPLRVALSGQKASPGPFEIMGVLANDEVIGRLKIAIQKLS